MILCLDKWVRLATRVNRPFSKRQIIHHYKWFTRPGLKGKRIPLIPAFSVMDKIRRVSTWQYRFYTHNSLTYATNIAFELHECLLAGISYFSSTNNLFQKGFCSFAMERQIIGHDRINFASKILVRPNRAIGVTFSYNFRPENTQFSDYPRKFKN